MQWMDSLGILGALESDSKEIKVKSCTFFNSELTVT